MSTEALTTSEIEGEILDRASVQSSIQRPLGLAADNRRAAPGERGVSEVMVNLYTNFCGAAFGRHIVSMASHADERQARSEGYRPLPHLQ